MYNGDSFNSSNMFLYFIMQKHIIAGITSGAVKG